jgi:hypothetical protein
MVETFNVQDIFICISELRKPRGLLDVRVYKWEWIVPWPEQDSC